MLADSTVVLAREVDATLIFAGSQRTRVVYLWIEDQLLFVEVQQRHRVGLGVVDKDLQAGIQRRSLTVGSARKNTLKHLLRTQHRHHLQNKMDDQQKHQSPTVYTKNKMNMFSSGNSLCMFKKMKL